jgi:MFS family permease
MSTTDTAHGRSVVPGLATIVGFLVCVEIASGILQGYYTPIFSDIAEHLSIKDADVNWFEAAQLVVSALVIPPLARLGDLVGHKKVLLLSTAVTALGSWVLVFAPSFTTFLIGWAIQGAYIVWLPLRSRSSTAVPPAGAQAPARRAGGPRGCSSPRDRGPDHGCWST